MTDEQLDRFEWAGTAWGPPLDDPAGVKERILRIRTYCQDCERALPIEWPDVRCNWCWQRHELSKVPEDGPEYDYRTGKFYDRELYRRMP